MSIPRRVRDTPSQERDPGKFHGIAPFDPETGLLKKAPGETFSSVFGKTLSDCAGEDSRICAITAAMEEGTGLTVFEQAHPERFFDVGIAEGHGVSMAAGMAKQGMIPVFAVYSTFLQRSYDMLVHDVALQKLHVVLGVDRAGLVGADGETHHGCLDVSYLTSIPGFTVLCPASFAELRTMLHQALFEIDGPVAIRYPRGGEGVFNADTSTQAAVRLKDGRQAVLIHLRNAGGAGPVRRGGAGTIRDLHPRGETQPHRPSGHGGDPPGDRESQDSPDFGGLF